MMWLSIGVSIGTCSGLAVIFYGLCILTSNVIRMRRESHDRRRIAGSARVRRQPILTHFAGWQCWPDH